MRARTWLFVAALALSPASFDSPALAQPTQGGMPNLRGMMGKPLPVADLAPGTVVVRVSRKLPMNGAADVEVQAVVTDDGGKSAVKREKTGPDGRATFAGLRPGSKFKAEAVVDGEKLPTTEFVVPAQGGVRTLLIAGVGGPAPEGAAGAVDEEASAEAASAAHARPRSIEAMTGEAKPDPALPTGALEVVARGADSGALVGLQVTLGQVTSSTGQMDAKQATTDAQGVARWSGLATGDGYGYLVIAEIDGARVGTRPFRMPETGGMRGEVRGLQITRDPKVVRLGERTQIIFNPRDEALVVWEAQELVNTSSQVFEPGPDGLEIPLPKDAQSAEALRESAPLELKQGGDPAMIYRGRIGPGGGPAAAGGASAETIFAFGLLSDGDTVRFSQLMPFGMERPIIVVPADSKLKLSAPGIKAQPPRQNASGFNIVVYELPSVPPGGTLAVTVTGIPARDRTGQAWAAGLAIALAVAGVGAALRPTKRAKAAGPTDELVARRETLFAELVAHEQARPEDANDQQDRRWTERRKEIVGKLESVYREIAAAERREEARP